MRRLARKVAHYNMERAGIHKPNRRYRGLPSFFAQNWRKYVAAGKRYA